MKNLFLLIGYFISTIARLLRPGGTKAVLAESLLVKHQLLILNRSRQRALNLNQMERILLGLWTLLINPRRIARSAVILKPSTLLQFHRALVIICTKRKIPVATDITPVRNNIQETA
jgi:hypothetical protein